MARSFSAFTFRGTLAVLNDFGIRSQVAEHVPQVIRELIDRPPLPVQWISGEKMDGLLDGIVAVGGEKLLKEVTVRNLERLIAPLVQPVLSAALTFFDANPVRVLSQLDNVGRSVLQGVTIQISSTGKDAAEIQIHAEDTPSRSWFASQLAIFEFTLGLCRKTLKSAEFVVHDDGRGATYRLSW
jgi:hypothetical protein